MFKRRQLPVFLQAELADCGLACLAMIFNYYYPNFSFLDMRRRVAVSIKGVSVLQLKKIAEEHGFVASLLRVELADLKTLSLPAILHWDGHHFVVLQSVTARGLVVHDPVRGKRVLSMIEVSRHFTGLVLTLILKGDALHAVPTPPPHAGFLKSILVKHYVTFANLLILSLFIQGCYIASIHLIQKAIDGAAVLWVLLSVKLLEYAGVGMRNVLSSTVAVTVAEEYGVTVMRRLLSLPAVFFTVRHSSDLLSRFTAVEMVRGKLAEGLVEGIVDGMIAVVLLILLLKINVSVALITVVFVLLFSVSRWYYHKEAAHYHELSLQARSLEVATFLETIRSIPAMKLLSKTAERLHAWRNKNIASLNAASQVTWHKLGFDSIKEVIFSLELSVTLCFACVLLSRHLLSLGMLYAYLAYRQQFVSKLGGLMEKLQDMTLLRLHVQRLDELASEPVELFTEVKIGHGDLELINVSFRYAGFEKLVLNTINLTIHQGECVAITGASGFGKTTLLKIMLGLMPPTEGELRYANVTIYPQHVGSYRQKIAAVLQDDVLLSGTILENIVFFATNPDLERVYQTVRLVGLWDEINAFTMRLYTLVGEMGLALSGGQKQRLLLARALYAQPEILLLDEATSHLDVKKEQEVNNSIKSLGMTVIMVCHRQETILMADRVIDLARLTTPISP